MSGVIWRNLIDDVQIDFITINPKGLIVLLVTTF